MEVVAVDFDPVDIEAVDLESVRCDDADVPRLFSVYFGPAVDILLGTGCNGYVIIRRMERDIVGCQIVTAAFAVLQIRIVFPVSVVVVGDIRETE